MAVKTIDYKVFMTDGSPAITVQDEPLQPEKACAFLERGGIIYFPQSPFTISAEDRAFLLEQQQESADYHKNIAYRPAEDRVTGVKYESPAAERQLTAILRSYSQQAQELVRTLLAPYARHWKIDFASFRPIEEKGRKMRLRARNDLLHVDSFPTRPIYGDRIFRVFMNVNPEQNRVWRTSETFEALAQQFQSVRNAPRACALGKLAQSGPLKQISKVLGLRANSASPYDRWMSDFHNFLKENSHFQETTRKDVWEFPPNSAWMVYTDMVSHSVLSGRFALEQTFIISKEDLVLPDKAPINILKSLYGDF